MCVEFDTGWIAYNNWIVDYWSKDRIEKKKKEERAEIEQEFKKYIKHVRRYWKAAWEFNE